MAKTCMQISLLFRLGILHPLTDRFRSFYCISPVFKADIYSPLKEIMLMVIHKTKGNKKIEMDRRRI